MELYYSGAKVLGVGQNDPNKSLGGFMSSTRIPKGRINNIFNDISQFSLERKESEHKAVFIKNTTGTTLTNVLIYSVNEPGSLFKLQIAAVNASTGQMELISNTADEPYTGIFYDINVNYSQSIMAVVGTLVIGDFITICGVTVEVTTSLIPVFIDNLVTAFTNNPLLEIVKITEPTVELVDEYGEFIVEDLDEQITASFGTTNLFFVRYKILGVFTTTPQVVSQYNNINFNNFGGGIDNSQIISTSLAPNAVIGLWFKKTINQNTSSFVNDDILYKQFVDSGYKTIEKENKTSKITINIDWV